MPLQTMDLTDASLPFVRAAAQPNVLFPHFAVSVTQPFADLLLPSLYLYRRNGDVGNDPPWEKKKFDKLVWRGRGNGGNYYRNPLAILHSQRMRLARLPHQQGNLTLHLSIEDTLNSTGPLTRSTYEAQDLAREFLDVRFTDGPGQTMCYDVCHLVETQAEWYAPYMSESDQNEYKYIFDVDGNGLFHPHPLSSTTRSPLSHVRLEWTLSQVS